MDQPFLYGVATSSYQIEGGVNKGGAGLSNWTKFSHTPGNVSNGDTGDTACNHYELWSDDIDLMSELGIQSYRFSISWARIYPDATGKINLDGIEFYKNLLKKLQEKGIEPMITLYHWDLPQWLEDIGGWASPQIVEHFNNYAKTVVSHLKSYCTKWITFNEPWVFLHKGYITGEHAPGISDIHLAGLCYVNILRAHAISVISMRNIIPNAEIGVACNVSFIAPASADLADIHASNTYENYINKLFLDPWITGKIPEIAFKIFGNEIPEEWYISTTEIVTHHDFIGLNYYSKTTVKHDDNAFLSAGNSFSGLPLTAMGWEIYPQGLTWLLLWVYNAYQTPIYITENGAAFDDEISNDNTINDYQRVAYFKKHLEAVDIAKDSGVLVRGYYAWSFLDNFEWEAGYEKRFGIVHVDFTTLKRTIKNSAIFYKEYINSRVSLTSNETDKVELVSDITN